MKLAKSLASVVLVAVGFLVYGGGSSDMSTVMAILIAGIGLLLIARKKRGS